jgi:putative ABC transport system permease protein
VTVELRGRPVRAEIVGVVGAVRHDGLELPPRDELFLPLSQQPSGSMTFVMEAAGDPRAVLGPAKAAIWKVDPLQTIYDAGTVPDLLSSSTAPRRFALVLTGVYAGAALGLAALGVYAVLAAATRQRTREIGVRLALGAPPPLIRREVLAHAARLGAVGLVAGLLCSAGVVQVLRGQLFATEPFDPVTVILVGGVVMAATIAAAYAPARRAMRIDPVMALRD